MALSSFATAVVIAAAYVSLAGAIPLDVNDTTSIMNASSTLAFGVQSWYHNNVTGTAPTAVGTFPQPAYWWEAGAVWGGMIDHWAYTNDSSYNSVIQQALLAQVGPDNNFMPPAYFVSLGNDDQAFWALAALSAVEYGFPVPAANASTTWLDLATAVWNTQWPRWDTTTCAGGLRWQIFQSNAGWTYKNSISNGAFFQMSARLARHTGNETYLDWANRTWNWMSAIGLIDGAYNVFDGSDDTINCTRLDHTIWSYNPATLLYGTASLYNYTNGSALWATRTEGLLTTMERSFFSPYPNATDIMYEPTCEPTGNCDYDQLSFKAYSARWMAKAAIVMPSIATSVEQLLSTSAMAAAQSCSGGSDNQTCGQKWYTGGYDGSYGLGQELSALETVQALLLLRNPIAPMHQGNVEIQTVTPTSTFSVAPNTATPDSASPARSSSPAVANLHGSIGLGDLGSLAMISFGGFVFGEAFGMMR